MSNTFEKVTNGWLDENEVCVKKTLRARHLIYLSNESSHASPYYSYDLPTLT